MNSYQAARVVDAIALLMDFQIQLIGVQNDPERRELILEQHENVCRGLRAELCADPAKTETEVAAANVDEIGRWLRQKNGRSVTLGLSADGAHIVARVAEDSRSITVSARSMTSDGAFRSALHKLTAG